MRYRMGLDMGTNSIGFAVIRIDDDNKPVEVEDMGVRIFSDGRNPKDNQPLALQRRMARGLRRQNDRRKVRRNRIVNVLVQNGFFPSDSAEREKLKNLEPYVLRVKALDEKLEPYELGRAIFHLGTRRGFQSNRLCNTEEQTATSSGDSKRTKLTQADKINKLTEDIEKSGCRTIGEYLHQRIQNGQVARFKGGDFEGYPSRQHYKTEFQLIRAKQVQFYPDADWQKIFDAIFTQRPLKEQERGQCQFYTDESRAYLCLPSAQQFRIAEEVNNLKYYDLSGITHDLTDEQKDCLINALNECKSKNFNSIRKLLKLDYKFNLENGKRTELKGNDTSCTLRKDEYIGKQWDELPLEIQDEIVDLLMDSQSNEEILENDYFAHLNLNDEQKDKVLSLVFPKKVGRLSSKFMRDCLPFMQHRHLRYDEAVAELGIHHSYNPITEHQDSLPYYGKVLTSLVSKTHPEADESDVEYKYGKIANPTVHIALNQLRRVVNSIIGDYGKPEQIVVELSRDISDSAEKRAETTKKQRENEKENSVAREEIMKISGIANPSGWDIKKYKLWKELGKDDVARRCPYCGKVIPANQLFSKEIEIEHILPYSRTLLDSMGNLTVAHSTCNLAKGNRTPYEAFSGNPAGFDWTEIMGRAQNLPNGKGKLFNKDAMKPFESGENGFIERQLNDNRYISKAARDYLACICPQNNIWGVPGKATAMLRRNWGLNSILSSNGNYKTRADHRHHSIDALVIALTDRSLLQEIAVENKANMDVTKIQVPDFPFSRQRVVRLVTDMNVSHKPDHGHQGRIFLETATGLKLVRKIIPVSELKEETYKENLIADRLHVQFISTCLADSGMTFRKAVKLLLQKESESRKTDKPVTEIFEKKWVTTKDISALDDKDILNGRIFSSRLNTIIRERTEDVISDKKALAQRLLEISDELGVKRVRYLPFSQTYEQIQSVPNKWYQLDGVCFATVWKMPGEKEEYVTQFIDYHQVYQHDAGKLSEYPKPHPAAKKIMTLYKGDIIRIQPKDSEKCYMAKVSGFSTTRNQMDLQPIKSAESIKEWKTETNAWVSPEWDFWDRLAEKDNYKSVNVLFKENNISLVKISPSGKIIF